MEQTQEKFETWAVVEIFGHKQLAGHVTEQTIGGSSFIRVDVPAAGGFDPFTKYYGQAAIYAIHPCTEDLARAAAEKLASGWGTSPLPVAVPDLTRAEQVLREARATAPQLAAGTYHEEYDRPY